MENAEAKTFYLFEQHGSFEIEVRTNDVITATVIGFETETDAEEWILGQCKPASWPA